MNYKNIIISMIMHFSTFTYAQENVLKKKWSLSECINYSIQNNIDIQIQGLKSQSNQLDIKQYNNERLFSLNGLFNNSQNYGRYLDPFNNSFSDQRTLNSNLSLNAEIVLYAGNYLNNKILISKLGLQSSILNNKKLENDIILLITTLYLEILYQKDLINLAKEQLEMSQNQLGIVEDLIILGKQPKEDLYKIKSQVINDKINLNNQKNTLKNNLLNLSNIMNIENKLLFDIQEIDEIPHSEYTSKNIEDIYVESLKSMPEIKAQEYNIRASEVFQKNQRVKALPMVSLGANIYTGYSSSRTHIEGEYPYFDQFIDNYNGSITLNVQIPIFNKFQTTTDNQKAKINYTESKLTLIKLKNNLFENLQKAYNDVIIARSSHEDTEEVVILSTKIYKFTEEKYYSGVNNILELDIAKLALLKARLNFLQSKYTLVLKIKLLCRKRGSIALIIEIFFLLNFLYFH
ncbi:TolC family protein [Flammeovirga pectinis]|nr:TolC family protein [Flammeovirga pectinis]